MADPPAGRGRNGLRQLWSVCLLWCLLALAASFGCTAVSGVWRAALVVLIVVLGILGVWCGLLAVLSSALVGLVRLPIDGGRSLSDQVPWWIWAPLSAMVGAVAGTGVYVDGPADLIAVSPVLVAVGLALTRRGCMSSRGRRQMWVCLALVGTSCIAVGLTIFA